MKTVLPLFIMIDACGWEIIKNDPFLKGLAPVRKKLDSVFGYSSTCVPSILSGRWPVEHRNWCYFVYDPKRSPFSFLKPLRWIPRALTGRRIVRRALTRAVRSRLSFKGYFDLYNMPFEHIALYDFTEKKSPLAAKGMNSGDNIFDLLERESVPYFVSNPQATEAENRDGLVAAIQSEEIDFAFCYWPALDGLLHRVGNDSPEIEPQLRRYEKWIGDILQKAEGHYEEVHLYVFSDHGMANCDVHIDLMARIKKLGLRVGHDFVPVYDSTMARFWFFNDAARQRVTEELARVPEGRIMPDAELKELKAHFEDGYFGELIFLMREGVLIVPSHMGERPIRAMHGYHPSDPHSFAVVYTNQPQLAPSVTAIPHIYNLMVQELRGAATGRDTEKRIAQAENRDLPLPAVA